VHNKFADVLTFLQAQGMPKLIGKNDHPRFIEQEVDIYEDDELSKLHAICSPYHSTLYDFLLMSGFREQEAMHVLWSNVRFNSNIVEMRWKPQFNWIPKAYKEREVPVPNELLESLEAYRISPDAGDSGACNSLICTSVRIDQPKVLNISATA
jgi:integrase/recombinase XerD